MPKINLTALIDALKKGVTTIVFTNIGYCNGLQVVFLLVLGCYSVC